MYNSAKIQYTQLPIEYAQTATALLIIMTASNCKLMVLTYYCKLSAILVSINKLPCDLGISLLNKMVDDCTMQFTSNLEQTLQVSM